MSRVALMFACAIATALWASGVEAADAKSASPISSRSLSVRVIASTGDTDCTAWRGGVKESGALAGVVSAVLPGVIEAGLESLSGALRKASGEDDKTATTEAFARTHLYDYDFVLRQHSWNRDVGCLRAMTSDGSFDAGFVFVASKDNSAFALRLAKLRYSKQINAGRELVGMTMAIVVKAADGTEVARGTLPGPFVLSATGDYFAPDAPEAAASGDTGKSPIISTGWMPLPPAGVAAEKLLASYDEQCAVRAEAGAAFRTVEIAKAMAATKDKKNFQPDPKLEMVPNDSATCGRFMPRGFPFNSWTQGREDALAALQKTLRKQTPVTVHLIVTETRDVNKFLLKVSEVLSASKGELKGALVQQLDPEKRLAAKKEADGLRENYEALLEQFREKVRLYEVAAIAQERAEQKLSDARAGANAEQIATAEDSAEKARVERAAAFQAALALRKSARAAAFDAGIAIGPGSPLETFGR